ncbi:ribonuclease T2 [Massilia sp. PAMC28688]|uniref:ribonuclease T2 family protein n=1 Tax=Massilia sp. PAMC28688 TaxID=2861283 RepID=UPI001C639E29|nr:ribonuclease T2 [Massilia sp. PAMC28688]QYF91776.1 ribonuclease T2 [Massilia sp. PAMC28688]
MIRTAFIASLFLASAAQAKGPRDIPGNFDFYTLAMSWSPSFCATNRDPHQCGRGLGFVLHGLWPQYEKGYPSDCAAQRLPEPIRREYAPIFASPRLAAHEWRRHGTCSGLDPVTYFKLSAQMKDSLRIPAAYQRPAGPVRVSPGELVQAFRAANPGMVVNAVLPFCRDGGRFLSEIQVCYNKAGRSRTCSEGQIKRSYNSCRQESFLLPSER